MFFESFLLNFTVAIALILALTFDYVTKYFSYWYVRHTPYKTPVPFYGSDYHRVLGFRSNTEEVNTLYSQHPKEPNVGRIKSRIPDLIVKDPDLIKKVLSADFENFKSRGLDLDKSQDVCKRNNLFYAEGEKWTLLRGCFESLLNDMNCVEDGLHHCLSGKNGDTNVQELLTKTLDAVFKGLLLDDVDGTVITEIRSAVQKRSVFDILKSYVKNIFPSLYVVFGIKTLSGQPSIKTTRTIQQSKLYKRIESLTQMYIKDKHKKSFNKPNDFAFGIIASFITEGYIPCLNLLTALLYELAQNTQSQEKVRNSNTEEYLDAVIKETLRLHPPFSVITRKCVKMYKFPESKMLIDRNVTMNVPVEAIHKDNAYYKNAEVFNPERFLEDNLSSNVFLPFGAGPRKCVGEKLSLQIIRNISRSILKRFEVEPSDKTPSTLPVVDHNFGRVVEKDIWLRFKPIQS